MPSKRRWRLPKHAEVYQRDDAEDIDERASLVDHHRKKRVMLASSAASFVLYGVSLLADAWIPEAAMARVDGVELWLFIVLVMCGVIASINFSTPSKLR